MLFKTLSVFAESGSGGGGGNRPPAGGGNGGETTPPGRIRGTRRNDLRRRVAGTAQGNANPNRQGMNPARYGPML